MRKIQPAVFFLLVLVLATGLVIYRITAFRAPGTANGNDAEEPVREINRHIRIGEARLMMTEEQIVRTWGEGRYVNGFGGHMRAYPEKGVSLAFPDDTDHPWFGRIVRIETTNPDHELFGVGIGDSLEAASAKLLQSGFASKDEVYFRGPFVVALSGTDKVESMSIGFGARSLKDRVY